MLLHARITGISLWHLLLQGKTLTLSAGELLPVRQYRSRLASWLTHYKAVLYFASNDFYWPPAVFTFSHWVPVCNPCWNQKPVSVLSLPSTKAGKHGFVVPPQLLVIGEHWIYGKLLADFPTMCLECNFTIPLAESALEKRTMSSQGIKANSVIVFVVSVLNR